MKQVGRKEGKGRGGEGGEGGKGRGGRRGKRIDIIKNVKHEMDFIFKEWNWGANSNAVRKFCKRV